MLSLTGDVVLRLPDGSGHLAKRRERRVTVPGSAGAGTGDSGGMPLTLPTCLHHRVVQEPEPVEAEPEAAPSEEPEPAPPASTAPEAGMLPAGTSAGDQEPAGDWAPAHSEADSVREELVSAPVPGPAFAMDPAPDNTCASALESAPASPPTPPPVERPEPLLVPTALLLEQLPFVLSPNPGNLQERFVPDVYIFPFCYILILILSLRVLYTIYHSF
ncbi:skin secretory protein xP2-like isoform X2 [Mustela erminea]|uniref:skin secretory protein xP2-like isoform X2 n=1 Tax=Mustela erminea TaxID=36723 RepID=UPI0013868109|nr:skin secretory protein xP2-like isoform X2 [Mustela erminea]XP_032205282.1 skin secretory protein xP2-like isoform X2 [Mustela erminea]